MNHKKTGNTRLICSLKNLLAVLPVFFMFLCQPAHATPGIFEQANTQYELKQYDSAIISFSQIISSFPGKKEAYFNRGLCYYHLKKYSEANKDFDSCIQIDSVSQEAIYLKALTLQQQDDWAGVYNQFIKLNTSYTGYNGLKKSIRNHNISVILSRNWYYMIAIMLLFIVLIGVVAKTYAVRKGY